MCSTEVKPKEQYQHRAGNNWDRPLARRVSSHQALNKEISRRRYDRFQLPCCSNRSKLAVAPRTSQRPLPTQAFAKQLVADSSRAALRLASLPKASTTGPRRRGSTIPVGPTVRVPHDWAIAGPFDPAQDGSTGKLPWRGVGWYRRSFTLDCKPNERVYLDFDGVMAFPKVYINGKLAGEWDYGYSPFRIDATPFVNLHRP